MGDDLRDRVPMPGLADCHISKGEVPLRARLKRRQEADKDAWVSLGSLWEEGEEERARERERKREEEREREKEKKGERDKGAEGSDLHSLLDQVNK